jgi:hypothetical protein
MSNGSSFMMNKEKAIRATTDASRIFKREASGTKSAICPMLPPHQKTKRLPHLYFFLVVKGVR